VILYPVLAAALGSVTAAAGWLAGYGYGRRRPCRCLPVVLEPRADGWRPATAAEYGARQAMNLITFSEIEALGELAERTFGHVWEQKP
jgi:hypothetical protein